MAYALSVFQKDSIYVFNEFTTGPDGSAEKWNDFIQDFFTNVLDGKMTKRPHLGSGFKFPCPSFIPVVETDYSSGQFGLIMHSPAGMAITQSVIDIIEKIEPGVHQYFPMRFVLRSGESEPEQYFLLNTCTYVQTLDLDNPYLKVTHSPEARHDLYPYQKYVVQTREMFKSTALDWPPKINVFKDKIKGRALWGEYNYQTIFSEEFIERVAEIDGFTDYVKPALLFGEI